MKDPGRLRDFYDASLPERLAEAQGEDPRVRLLSWLLRQELAPGDRVLDVGCGVGWSTHAIRKAGATATGIDFSPVLIAEAKRRYGGDFQCQDASRLDLGTSFSVVTCLDCLEHLSPARRPAFYEGVSRHLAPGGSFLLNLPNPAYLRHLRAHRPELLQLVDEPVELREILEGLGAGFVLSTAILYGIDVEDQYFWYRFRKDPTRWERPRPIPSPPIPPWPASPRKRWGFFRRTS
jgi:SAM-dependent methyltransferase